MTTRAARRSRTRRTPATSASRSAARVLLMDTGRAAAARGQPGGACRLPVVRAVAQVAAHRGQLRPAGDQPRNLAAGRARDRRAFDRDVQRHVVVPLSSNAARSSACSARRSSAARPTSQVDARGARRRHRAARLARRLRRPLRRDPSARADALAPTAAGSTARTCSCRPTATRSRRTSPTNSRCASTCIRRSRPTG